MPNDSNPMVITYGGFTLDFNTLPQASLTAMVKRGVSHFFGSEQASKVTAFFDPDKDVPELDTPEARAAKKAEFQKAAYENLLAGTVGVSTRGPSVDPITTIARRLARNEVKTILAKNKIKWPTKADDVIETPDGGKFTGAQLIDRRLANPAHSDRIAKDAKKIADDQAKKNKKVLETTDSESISDL